MISVFVRYKLVLPQRRPPCPKATPTLDLSAYSPVAERIRLFYERFPAGRIVTELVSSESRDGATVVTFRALAFRAATDTLPAATGWASERDDDGEINAVACLENAETSAIGRALANLGFATSVRPSREEMAKANRARLRIAERSPSPVARHSPRSSVTSPTTHRSRATRDSIVEVLSLTDELARADVAPERMHRLRQRLVDSPPSIASLARVERLLGRWLARLGD